MIQTTMWAVIRKGIVRQLEFPDYLSCASSKEEAYELGKKLDRDNPVAAVKYPVVGTMEIMISEIPGTREMLPV